MLLQVPARRLHRRHGSWRIPQVAASCRQPQVPRHRRTLPPLRPQVRRRQVHAPEMVNFCDRTRWSRCTWRRTMSHGREKSGTFTGCFRTTRRLPPLLSRRILSCSEDMYTCPADSPLTALQVIHQVPSWRKRTGWSTVSRAISRTTQVSGTSDSAGKATSRPGCWRTAWRLLLGRPPRRGALPRRLLPRGYPPPRWGAGSRRSQARNRSPQDRQIQCLPCQHVAAVR
jgi:hypothetical protein